MSNSTLKKQMPLTSAKQIFFRSDVSCRYLWATMLKLTAAAALLATGAQARATEAAVPAQVTSPTQAAQAAAPVVVAAARYTATDIERAFGYLDANKDSRISRDEAAGFRGVARHFDKADSNKDHALSREEFENALNGKKSRQPGRPPFSWSRSAAPALLTLVSQLLATQFILDALSQKIYPAGIMRSAAQGAIRSQAMQKNL